MFEYSSVTINPTLKINVDILNQMVLNDAANEQMRFLSLEAPLAYATMDNNVGDASSNPKPDTSTNALYFAKNATSGVQLNIDNVINSPLSVEVSVDRAGVYRFYVVALVSSGSGNCIPSFQITDIDTNIVQEVGGYITTGVQSSNTGHFYTPSILFVDRWLYGGKTYKFTVTTGLLGTNSDIAYINAYKFPPTIAYFWVQGYNGTGQQIEVPNFSIPSFAIDIPNFELPNLNINFDPPNFDFPDFQFPDFSFGDFGGFDLPDFNPSFPFGQDDVFFFDDFSAGGLNVSPNFDDVEGGNIVTWNLTTPTVATYHVQNNVFSNGSAVVAEGVRVVDSGTPSGSFSLPFAGEAMGGGGTTHVNVFTQGPVNNMFTEIKVGACPSTAIEPAFEVYMLTDAVSSTHGFVGRMRYYNNTGGGDPVPTGWTSGIAFDSVGGGAGHSLQGLGTGPTSGSILRLQWSDEILYLILDGTVVDKISTVGQIFTGRSDFAQVGFTFEVDKITQNGNHTTFTCSNYTTGDISVDSIRAGIGSF